MYKDIYDLIRNKSNKGRLLSKNDIIYIAKRIASVYKVDQYSFDVDVVFKPFEFGSRVYFSPYDSSIYFNLSRFKELYKDELPFVSNVSIVYELLHEITHIEQIRMYKNHTIDDYNDPLVKLEYYLNDSFFSAIYAAGFSYNVPTINQLKVLKHASPSKDEEFYKNLRGLYESFHDGLPCERMATIRGLKFAINLVEDNSKDKYREKLSLLALKRALYYFYSCGYTGDGLESTPILSFMRLFGFREDIPYITELIQQIYDEYDLDRETRVEYGLDIDDSTLNYVKEQHCKYDEEIKELIKK